MARELTTSKGGHKAPAPLKPPATQVAAQRSREWRMRHQALQIAAQLPENEADAMRILGYVRELVIYCLGVKPLPEGSGDRNGTVQKLFG